MSHGVPVRPKSLFYLGLLLAVTSAAGAQGVDLRQVPGTGGSSDGFLMPDQAFVLTAESESHVRVNLGWQIA
jgi:thiol:disulfide interchange protein